MDSPAQNQLPPGYVAIGFAGKPVLDIRILTPENVATLTRPQMRDIMYSLGRQKPAWGIPALRNQVAAIIDALKNRNARDMSHLEAKFGITIPKPGLPFNAKSVPVEEQIVKTKHKEKSKEAQARGRLSIMKQKEKRACKTCGQMARNYCFYKCCKQCCVQLKNPCTVHVLTGRDAERSFQHRKKGGYGELRPAFAAASPHAFPLTSEVAGMVKPQLRDLKENLDAYVEESKEVLKWRTKVMAQTTRAEEEAAIEALDRYERNCKLLERVMQCESLDRIVAESKETVDKVQSLRSGVVNGKLNIMDSASNEDAARSRNTIPMETYGGAPTTLKEILRKFTVAKSRQDLQKHIAEVGGLKGTSLETIEHLAAWFGGSSTGSSDVRFEILEKSSAPKPDLKNVVDMKCTNTRTA